jgi:hypothetical protein
MKPVNLEWDKLSSLERLAVWFEQNKSRLNGRIREYRRLMENFYISCENVTYIDYLNFQRDIRFYNPQHQEVLIQGFFAMYNTTPATLELHSIDNSDPRRN